MAQGCTNNHKQAVGDQTLGLSSPRLPIHATYNPRERTSTLWYDDRTADEYYMRGALTWPRVADGAGLETIYGYAICCAQNVQTGVWSVLEERPWQTVEGYVIGGRIMPGLAEHLSRWWALAYLDTYYIPPGPEGLRKQFTLAMVRSPGIQPKPQIIEAPFTDWAQAWPVFSEYVASNRFVVDPVGGIARMGPAANVALAAGRASAEPVPPVACALTLVTAVERWPYRRPGKGAE